MGRPGKWQANSMLQKLVDDARQHKEPVHWLDLQKSDRYKWEEIVGRVPETTGRRAYYRHIGVVEGLFESDGSLFCGRADLQQNHYYDIKTSLNDSQLRERIVLAWALLRHSHILMSCEVRYQHEIVPRPPSSRWSDKCFIYHCPRSVKEAVEETREHVIFIEDNYSKLDAHDFYQHLMNTNRALNPKRALSRVHVLPIERRPGSTARLHFMLVLAHQITDGLTMYRWSSHFAHILNMNERDIKTTLSAIITDPQNTPNLLPPSQESLYPVRSPNLARQRWHWLITRILRNVRTPPPGGFPNPLKRNRPLTQAQSYPPLYSKILDYNVTPPLNSGHAFTVIEGSPVHNLRILCKQARISIGSGCFALVAIVMMILEERRNPGIPLASRAPFVTGFPVNPRPFLSSNTTGQENSCMLAFSDGITLPFLPTELPFTAKFKVLGRLAHRQLRQFQKRPRSLSEEISMGSRSPNQLLPSLYCSTLERLDDRYPESQKAGITVQGAFPARNAAGPATCGVSAVGSIVELLTPPVVDLDDPVGPLSLDDTEQQEDKKDLIARFDDMVGGVRPRECEFLVGVIGDGRIDRFSFNVSYDANAIDPDKVGEWQRLIGELLENAQLDDTPEGGEAASRARL